MKRRDLEKHLREHGCEFSRHASEHDMWVNPANEHEAPIPRHRDVKIGTARNICKRLQIPAPRIK